MSHFEAAVWSCQSGENLLTSVKIAEIAWHPRVCPKALQGATPAGWPILTKFTPIQIAGLVIIA
jgi:hypothetical protein